MTRSQLQTRVAGTDTREAMSTATVRAAVAAAALVAGPGWAAALSAPAAWNSHLGLPSTLEPWAAIFLVFAGIAVAIIASRQGAVAPTGARTPGQQIKFPVGILPAVVAALVAMLTMTQHDLKSISIVLPVLPLVSGWVVGQCVRLAVSASVPEISSAAAGVVVGGALMGLAIGGHIELVAKGSGVHRAAGWATVYLSLAILNLIRAHRRFPHDLAVVRIRMSTPPPAAHLAGGPVFALRNIDVAFRNNRVLIDATLETYPGELVALVGGNGAGKSTLLRVAAGLITPSRGSITVGENDVTTLLPEERAAAGLAFISGARPVFPDLTVLENLRVAAFRSHLTSRSFDDATEAVLEIVPALAARRKSKAGVLSGGEQRLLAVAQMLYRRPAILLADELSLGLDADARVAVLDLLRVLADQGVSAVVVDHDLPSLLSRATRAVLITGGGTEDYARPEELLIRRADLLPATFLAGANG